MTRRSLKFRPDAEAELSQAARWYEENRRGLGSEFVRAVEASLDSIARNPEMFPRIANDLSRALVKRFPFGIFYSFNDIEIVVLAVFHARRDRRQISRRQ